jgi:hypothetical protein
MKKLIPFFALWSLASLISAQTVLYNQDFNSVSVPDLPGDWFATSAQVFTNASSPSSGYSGASGGSNLLARNCNPNNESRSFQVDGISSLGYSDLTVSFGHRRTNSFTPAIALEWSSDGSSWNAISYNSSSAGTTWTLFTSATLPAGANNKPGLSFRWTYTTNVGNVPCDNFAGNYRLDDFKVTAATTLPVELVAFRCTPAEKSIRLDWRTATENLNDFFAVEHSTDSRVFREIGRVNGAGTTALPQDYDFIHEQPASGINYYRLRQTDFDGHFSYSRVVWARHGNGADLRIFPMPVSDVLHIGATRSDAEHFIWEIADLNGRILLSGDYEASQEATPLDVSALASGVYLLRLSDERETSVRKFEKI